MTPSARASASLLRMAVVLDTLFDPHFRLSQLQHEPRMISMGITRITLYLYVLYSVYSTGVPITLQSRLLGVPSSTRVLENFHATRYACLFP